MNEKTLNGTARAIGFVNDLCNYFLPLYNENSLLRKKLRMYFFLLIL